MYTRALFIIAKKWKPLKCLSVDEWINKMWSIHAMEYSAIKRNDVQIYAMTWMDLENMMLSERSQTQEATYCVTPFI